jgi:hypothetical protein
VLRGLAAAESVHLAATSRVLRAFDAAEDYAADGQAGPRAWLAWQTRVTRPAAGAALAWARRLAARRQVAGALAAGSMSASYARRVCDWVDELPGDVQAAAEEILVAAAVAGADMAALFTLVEEIRVRTARPDGDGGDDRFGRRWLRLDSYFRGNGSLQGELTAPAAAALQAVLDTLGGRAGPEDTRTRAQRDHDALEEACRRLIAAGCLPGRAGQAVQIVLHMTLAQLLGHAGLDPALAAWIGATGVPAPPGADCDAQIVPLVTGTIDQAVLDGLVDRHPGCQPPGHSSSDGDGGSGTGSSGGDSGGGDGGGGHDRDGHAGADSGSEAGHAAPGAGPAGPVGAVSDQTLGRARRAAAGLTIADALRLLSGPGALASALRGQLTGPAGTISLPLDVGAAADIPAHLRRALTRRDQHCRFPGCDQPPEACHVHHLRRRADGGATAVTNCCLLCSFHHLTAVHRWGWQLTLNPDGTTTAVSPDGKRTFHSHAPPTAA